MELARVLAVSTLLCACVCVSEVACEERTVRFEIHEELRPPVVIGTLAGNASWSADGTRALGGIRFKLMSASRGAFIRFRERDGRLTAEERVDRERICKRSPRCVIAFDVASVSAEQFELIHVEVEVLDVNDNAPEFPRAEVTVEISESAPLGTRVALDAAEDADAGSNSVQSYHLSENAHFGVDVITRADGVKYAELVLVKELDRETRALYALRLLAADGGQPERSGATNVTVRVKDANDNSPRFEHSRYSVDVPEDAPPETVILELSAVDADEGPNGQVVYEFGKQVSAKIRRLFRLDYKTGVLVLQSSVDYEDEATYEIDVQASDLGQNPVPSACRIIINVLDVNDNAPQILITSIAAVSDGVALVSEASAVDVLVALISVRDRDGGPSGRVSCSLSGGNGGFRLKRAYEGSYSISTASTLDRETLAEYNLTVAAEDFGVPPLHSSAEFVIRLTDVNDNAPAFSADVHEGFIEENQPPGTFITSVMAGDADSGMNGEISFELFDSDSGVVSRFAIMNGAGNVYALQSFNREVTERLDLRIRASDRGWPQLHSTAALVVHIVDQNDNPPIVTHPPLQNGSAEINLPRDAPPGYILTRIIASDSDAGLNAELAFRLSVDDSDFAIDPNTGEIYIRRKISYDELDQWRVLVLVSDCGRPALTSTASILFSLSEAVAGGSFLEERAEGGSGRWTLILVLVLTGCSMLLLSVLVLVLCRTQKRSPELDVPFSEEKKAESMISSVFDTHTFSSSSPEEAFSETPQAFKSTYRSDIDGYSTLPGYGRDPARPITVWKGNSMMTIAVREPQISGKDSGKGDSDVNDSDSDISEGLRKDYSSYRGLWACTSECRTLGHSDRCWSPSVSLSSRHLSTFSRTRSGDTHSGRAAALHSLTEDQQSPDYIHVCSPRPQRRPGATGPPAFTHTSDSPA